MNSDQSIPDESLSSVMKKGEETTDSSHSSLVLSRKTKVRDVGPAKCTLQMMDDNIGGENSSRTSNGQNSSEVSLDLQLKQPYKAEPKFNWVDTSFEKEDKKTVDLTLSLVSKEELQKKKYSETNSESFEKSSTELRESTVKYKFDLNLPPDSDDEIDVPTGPSIHSEVIENSSEVPGVHLSDGNKLQVSVLAPMVMEDEGGIAAKSLKSEYVEHEQKQSDSAKASQSAELDADIGKPKVNSEDESGVVAKSSNSDSESAELNQKESISAKDVKEDDFDANGGSPNVNSVKILGDDEYTDEVENKEKASVSAKDIKEDDFDANVGSPNVNSDKILGVDEYTDEFENEEEVEEFEEAFKEVTYDEEFYDYGDSDADSGGGGDVAGDGHGNGDDEQREESAFLDKEAENSIDVEDAIAKHVPQTEEGIEKKEAGIVVKAQNKHPLALDGPATKFGMKKYVDDEDSVVERTVKGNHAGDLTRVDSASRGDASGRRYKRFQHNRVSKYDTNSNKPLYRKKYPNHDGQMSSCKRKEKFFDKSFRPSNGKGNFFKKSYGWGKPDSRWNRDKSPTERFHESRGDKYRVNQFDKQRSDYSWTRKDRNQNFLRRENAPEDSRSTRPSFRRQSEYMRRRHTEEQNINQVRSHGRYTESGANFRAQRERSISPATIRSRSHGRYTESGTDFRAQIKKSMSPSTTQSSHYSYMPCQVPPEQPLPNARFGIRHDELAADGPHFYAPNCGLQNGLPQPEHSLQMNRNIVDGGNGNITDRRGVHPDGDFHDERYHHAWNDHSYGTGFWHSGTSVEPESGSRVTFEETTDGQGGYHARKGWQSTGFGEAGGKRRKY